MLIEFVPPRRKCPAHHQGDMVMTLMTWLITLFALGVVAFTVLFACIPACDKV